jgi:DNA-directed RNA polymerase subunit H (RpoH/RPB5)
MKSSFIKKHKKKLIAGVVAAGAVTAGIIFRKELKEQIGKLSKIYDSRCGPVNCPVQKKEVIKELVGKTVDPRGPYVIDIKSEPVPKLVNRSGSNEVPEHIRLSNKRIADRLAKKEIERLQLQRIKEHQMRLKNVKAKVNSGYRFN